MIIQACNQQPYLFHFCPIPREAPLTTWVLGSPRHLPHPLKNINDTLTVLKLLHKHAASFTGLNRKDETRTCNLQNFHQFFLADIRWIRKFF